MLTKALSRQSYNVNMRLLHRRVKEGAVGEAGKETKPVNNVEPKLEGATDIDIDSQVEGSTAAKFKPGIKFRLNA